MSDPDSSADSSSSTTTIPNQFQKRTFWMAITALSIVAIGAVAVGFVMLTGTVLSYLQPVLVPLAVAGIIAYLLDPIIAWLERRGWSHKASMMTVFLAFIALVILLIVAVLVPTIDQGQEVYKKWDSYQTRATALVEKGVNEIQERFGVGVISDYTEQFNEWVSKEGAEVGKKVGAWLWERVRGAFGFLGYILGLLLVPIYLFYFLREGHHISKVWSDYIPLRASTFKDEVVGTLKEINGYLISFFRGQMVVSIIDGVLVAVALSCMGLPYALLIGVFLALLGLIPYIGNLLVMIPAVLIAIAHYGTTEWVDLPPVEDGNTAARTVQVGDVIEVKLKDSKSTDKKVVAEVSDDGKRAEVLVNAWTWMPRIWVYPVIVLLIFIVLQQVNGLVTAPKIVGDSVGLHPLTVIFSVLFWSLLLGGLLGALLAVPLTASIKVLFRRYIWAPRVESKLDVANSDDEEDGDSDGEEALEDGDPEPQPA